MLISQILAHIDFLETAIEQVQTEDRALSAAVEEALELLQTIPGCVGVAAAGDPGRDRPGYEPLSYCMAPGVMGRICRATRRARCKRMKGPMNRGNLWLRSIMGEVAWASVETRATYFYGALGSCRTHRS